MERHERTSGTRGVQVKDIWGTNDVAMFSHFSGYLVHLRFLRKCDFQNTTLFTVVFLQLNFLVNGPRDSPQK